jgi:hypothetical protein
VAAPRRWAHGDVILRRERLGLFPAGVAADLAPRWLGRAWLALPVFVVEDTDEALVTFIAPGAELGFPAGQWPIAGGHHPWSNRLVWTGHGALMVQRPGEHHAVWHFWTGPEREFSCWYINLQTDFVRTALGYDTQDLELDILVAPDGTWALKDREVLDDRVAEGRFTAPLVEWIVRLGEELTTELDAGRRWWDDRWASWEPPDGWTDPSLPAGWQDVVA